MMRSPQRVASNALHVVTHAMGERNSSHLPTTQAPQLMQTSAVEPHPKMSCSVLETCFSGASTTVSVTVVEVEEVFDDPLDSSVTNLAKLKDAVMESHRWLLKFKKNKSPWTENPISHQKVLPRLL